MEFLAEGSDDCPLIRLYDFDLEEAAKLRELFLQLANGTLASIPLHEQEFINSIEQCRLLLLVDRRDIGISLSSSLDFSCISTKRIWADAASLSEIFIEPTNKDVYQWLNEYGEVSLLLSPSGRW
jgi:hypothetical protein